MSNEFDAIRNSIFKRIKDKAQDLSPLMKKIAADMKDAVYQNFEEEGRPKWKPLAKSTIRERRKLGYWPGKILQRRSGGGGLLGSITSRYDSHTAEVGTNKVYAAMHQYGGTINQAARSSTYVQQRYKRGSKKGKFKRTSEKNRVFGQGFTYKARSITVPARPFLKITDEELQAIKKRAITFLTKI